MALSCAPDRRAPGLKSLASVGWSTRAWLAFAKIRSAPPWEPCAGTYPVTASAINASSPDKRIHRARECFVTIMGSPLRSVRPSNSQSMLESLLKLSSRLERAAEETARTGKLADRGPGQLPSRRSPRLRPRGRHGSGHAEMRHVPSDVVG